MDVFLTLSVILVVNLTTQVNLDIKMNSIQSYQTAHNSGTEMTQT